MAQNFYWLSDKPDVFAWDKTTWAYTPMKGYADFTVLNSLPETEITTTCTSVDKGDKLELNTKLENHSDKVAFFINLALLDDKGNQVFPALWDDNYISILPGEKREITCSMSKSSLKPGKNKLQVSGWNVGKQMVEIQ